MLSISVLYRRKKRGDRKSGGQLMANLTDSLFEAVKVLSGWQLGPGEHSTEQLSRGK